MTTTTDVPAERGRDEMPSLNDLRDWAGRWLDEHREEAAHARRYAALLRSPEAPDDPFGTAEESEADAESADAEAAMYAAVLALLAPQEAREPEAESTLAELVENVAKAARMYGVGSEACVAAQRAVLAAARPAPETERESELLGYVVERQRTPGEWVRVWTGRTLWFDHDEAVLERDAYALDGIPARIRPVYLGAPATETSALDAIRRVLGIEHDADGTEVWYVPAEPNPVECATLEEALREFVRMVDAELAPASGEPSGAGAVVREAAPFSDTAVARIIEAVEKHCGMGHGAWDMVSARDLVEGFAAVFGADTSGVLLPTAPGAPEEAGE